MRDVATHKQLVSQIQKEKDKPGKKVETKAKAKKMGLTLKRSWLWDIPVFAERFFWSHPNCYLHLEKEGLLRKWITFFGLKYGREFCEKINVALVACTASQQFLPLPKVSLRHSPLHLALYSYTSFHYSSCPYRPPSTFFTSNLILGFVQIRYTARRENCLSQVFRPRDGYHCPSSHPVIFWQCR